MGKVLTLVLVVLTGSALAETRTVTLLFTNDIESVYDPTPAFWRDDINMIGGVPQLATLIDAYRDRYPDSFLFDAGDIYTGTLSKVTRGELPFELMISMDYDAMVIGNHEFEYGWQALAVQKQRAPFPVLGANLFYKGTDHPYAQAFAIIERNNIRIGVIGILGLDAATALIPSNIAGVEVKDPVKTIAKLVDDLREDVDLIVVLAHQGPTAPMQTDDAADPEIHRGNEANLKLAGAVPGIDVIFAGHTDAGTREPLVEPENGTLIMQTFGQGQHLGVLQIELDEQGQRIGHRGELIPVNSDKLSPHPAVANKLARYRAAHPELYEVIGHTQKYLGRRYNYESDLGNLFADVLTDATGAPIGLMPSGALRRDIAAGPIRRVDALDAFPFEDDIAVVEMTGALLKEVIEQGLSLERGILQVAGLSVTYDPDAKKGERIIDIYVGRERLQPRGRYQVATVEILAKGGDQYTMMRQVQDTKFLKQPFSEALVAFIAQERALTRPPTGRLLPKTSQ